MTEQRRNEIKVYINRIMNTFLTGSNNAGGSAPLELHDLAFLDACKQWLQIEGMNQARAVKFPTKPDR